MKRLFLIFALIHILGFICFASEPSNPDSLKCSSVLQPVSFTVSDSWFSRDKAHHFLTSAFLSASGFYYFNEVIQKNKNDAKIVGVSFSLTLGIIKEIRDGMSPRNNFSWKDLAADILGCGAGILIMNP